MPENEEFVPFNQEEAPATKGQKTFDLLPMTKLRLKDKNTRRYFIYKNPKEYIEVEAETAKDALQKGEVVAPYKIVHFLWDLGHVIEKSLLEPIENNEKLQEPPPETPQ